MKGESWSGDAESSVNDHQVSSCSYSFPSLVTSCSPSAEFPEITEENVAEIVGGRSRCIM